MDRLATNLDHRVVAQINGIVGHAHRVSNAYRAAASRLHDLGPRALVGRLLQQHQQAVDRLEDRLAEQGWMFPTRSDVASMQGEEFLRVDGVNCDDALLEALADIDAWLAASAGRKLDPEVPGSVAEAIRTIAALAERRRSQLLLSDTLIHRAEGSPEGAAP